ncbi:MAG: glycoside hydrolase family 13 protein [Jatrophihabitans sp.]
MVRHDRTEDPAWWKNAVFYQVYPRSFADSTGDGNGDLPGVTGRMDYLAGLGVDAVWISPFYTSPMVDNGYDVADPCDVDPMFGTLADFDELVAAAHRHGIKVTVDIVPNHFSDQHVWFVEALAAAPGSAARERFIFCDGKGDDGELPPNNWPAMFGGPAWTRVPDGQWYLHLFAPEQPDLNWENPEIPAEFARIIRFWVEHGADGFRMDVAHGMAKPAGLPDVVAMPTAHAQIPDDPRFDQPQVHEYLRGFRSVLDEFPGVMVVGEAWVDDPERMARYVRPDELHLTFNFELVLAEWGAENFRRAIDDSLAAMAYVGAPCTWVLSNHDVIRHATRYGGGEAGAARGRAASLLQLALPGAAYIYNGDELGLQNVELPDGALRDPTWERSGHTQRGRDGERVPMPWCGDTPPFGFSSGRPWLPMPAQWAGQSAADQADQPDSPLQMYRSALRLRHSLPALLGSQFSWVDSVDGVLAFRRGSDVTVAINLTDGPLPGPTGEVLLSSEALHSAGELPANTTVWLRTTAD